MSEFIIIQVGQCGNQIGSVLWSLILEEYGIPLHDSPKRNTDNKDEVQKSISSFFNVSGKSCQPFNNLKDLLSSKVKARAVCIDMEDSVVSRIRNGSLRGLFDKKCFITNYPGSGNNWAEGFCEHGSKYKDRILGVIQQAVERCDSLHGFLLLFSTGGGTGSGLGTFTLKLLADYYPEVERFVSCVYPTGTEDVITCPYNMNLATKVILENSTCVFPIENRSLLDIVSRQFRNNSSNGYSSLHKPFEDMNAVIVNMLLHLTSGSRFPGSLNFDMNEINTNMVPFPNINFLSSGFHNFQSGSIKNGKFISKQYKDELFMESCNKRNQLIKVDPLGPKSVLLGTTLVGRGGYTLTDMRNYMEKVRNRGRFTSWSEKSVKIGLCNFSPCNSSLAMFSLFNTTAMASLFEHINRQFVKLYNKKAHIHHYTKVQGFDMDFFDECNESLKQILHSYKEIESSKPLKIDRLKPRNEAN